MERDQKKIEIAMAKKKIEEKQMTEEEKIAVKREEERRQAIAEFNVNNMGKFWIDPAKVPTEEDINKAKFDFEDAAKKLNDRKDYVVADKENALRVAKFMKDFNDNSFWSQRMFVGVLNFSDLLNEFIKGFDENDPKELALEYAPVQYAFILFENYAGFGYEAAKHMAEIWDEYLPIYERLHELVDEYKAETQKVEDLQQVWGMMAQGYYTYIMTGTENDPVDTVENTEAIDSSVG